MQQFMVNGMHKLLCKNILYFRNHHKHTLRFFDLVSSSLPPSHLHLLSHLTSFPTSPPSLLHSCFTPFPSPIGPSVPHPSLPPPLPVTPECPPSLLSPVLRVCCHTEAQTPWAPHKLMLLCGSHSLCDWQSLILRG